jgi:hypothetical protein
MNNKLTIYCDLDGLFADFDKGVKGLTGSHPKDLEKKFLWKAIHWNKQFFLDLELIEGSWDLWEAVRNVVSEDRIKFLTGAPSSHVFREQKKLWVAKTFGPQYEVNVVPRRDKQLHSGPLKILIDDTEANIHDWVAKGGHGIHHRHVNFVHDFDSTIAALRQYEQAIKG